MKDEIKLDIADLEFTVNYPVMEHFYTLQGEGAYAGHAAYFIRLGGCDVGCVWCDVKESWPIDAHPKMSVAALLAEASKYPGRLIVITGGEPTMHNLEPLTTAFRKAGFRMHIETSGSSPLTGKWDWITLSPKKFKAPLEENCIQANELKIIIFNKSDFQWAEQYLEMVSNTCKLYLQVEWSKAHQLSPLIVDYIKTHPQWHMSMQTHKYLNIP
jgi:7-carboxy-7-deazaguanine synthase